MKVQFLSLFFFIFPIYLCQVNIGNNECEEIRSRVSTRQQAYTVYRDSYYKCGKWLSRRRCHRESSATAYRSVYYTQYYKHVQCCSGYVRHNGFCKRAVVGLEGPSIIYLEKSECTKRICVRMTQNSVGTLYDDQIHILNYRVTSYNRQLVADGKEFLSSSSVRRQCFNVDISNYYKAQGDLTVTLTRFNTPNYTVISPSSRIIRPRQAVSIGFEDTEMVAYENAGNLSLCISILRPVSLAKVENVNFGVHMFTRSNSSRANLDFIFSSTYIYLSKYLRRACRSISIVSDHIHEEEEEFQVVLSGNGLPEYVTLAPSTSRIKIMNVKRKFSIGFSLAELEVVENAGSTDICITSTISNYHNGAVVLEVVIPITHTDDLSLSQSMIQFDSTAHAHQCLTLNITDDSDKEGNEVVVLMLEVNSTTEPFYMDVSPSSMKLKLIDNDCVTIGFNYHVMKVVKGSSFQVCADVISGEDLISGAVILFVKSEDGTADSNHYLPVLSVYSSLPQTENCFSGLTLPFINSDQQPRTFSLVLTKTQYSNTDNIILDPEVVLVKITDKDNSSCTSGNYLCETGCLDSGNWTKSSSSKPQPVSDDVCLSKEAVIKTRDATDSCTTKGQFCVESTEEKMIRSFQLGVSPQMYTPETKSESCSQISGRLTCTPDSHPETDCQLTRPPVCQKRSILLVLDSSQSVGSENFENMKQAMSELIQHFCGNIQVAVAKFNEHAFLDLCFNCLTESRHEKSQYIRNNVKYENNGAKSFENSTKCIFNQAFNDKCGNHSQSDCIDIIFVTNGGLSSGSCGRVQSWLPTKDSICSKSKVFAIGVGKDVEVNELSCIASAATNDTETVFLFDTFYDLRKYVTKAVQYLYRKKKHCNVRSIVNTCENNRIDLACRD